MLGMELDAAFEQELRFVENSVAGGDFGQQPHPLRMGFVGAQKMLLAQPLGVRPAAPPPDG